MLILNLSHKLRNGDKKKEIKKEGRKEQHIIMEAQKEVEGCGRRREKEKKKILQCATVSVKSYSSKAPPCEHDFHREGVASRPPLLVVISL